ncbi:zinc finger and SCAN domain-containing protein 22 [Xenopus laevis]|nr:zinc finger and SCAN domain-containing protein 22 [Xenopus laevis]
MREDIVIPNFYNHLGFMQQEGPCYGAVSSQWIAAGTELIKLNTEPFATPLLKPPWSFTQNSSLPERDRMWNPADPSMESVRSMEQDFLRPLSSYTSSLYSKGGSYQEKINRLKDPALSLPFATCEPENASYHSNNNSILINGTIDLTDPSQDSKGGNTCESEENKFLLIDDRGIPYTVFKKDLINSPETDGELDEDSQIPKRFHYCPMCFRSFLYLSDLERHSVTHSEHKPFECKVCGKSFKRSSHLQRHKHIHTGERPFQCIICKKGFRESGELQRHQRVHTGEKPYQCELCHLRFTERNTLRRHTKRKHFKELLYQQDPGDSSDWGEVIEDISTEDNIE